MRDQTILLLTVKVVGLKDIKYIFYSGGYDSTSYLLECLVKNKLIVQPVVVITSYIDGTKDRMRPSFFHEKISRENFYRKFKSTYPKLKDNLLPEITINDVSLDEETKEIGIEGYNEGLFTRKTNQLLYFHQTCKNEGYDKVSITYQKDDPFSGRIRKYINKDNPPKSMGWAKHLEFPLIDKTKKNILEESIENGYEQFLYETWSCWYPNEDNQPCGKCALCEITIVETTLEIPKTII